VHRDDAIGEILVPAEDLRRRVVELAAEVSRDYAGKDLLLIGVLKGAVFFISDLMQYLLRNLRGRNPRSLEVCALLIKPERQKVNLETRYVGFEIPDRFAIGYGLDHAERYRNLPYVAALRQ
jgi:hypoxanthine phosphoribosyltransferase